VSVLLEELLGLLLVLDELAVSVLLLDERVVSVLLEEGLLLPVLLDKVLVEELLLSLEIIILDELSIVLVDVGHGGPVVRVFVNVAVTNAVVVCIILARWGKRRICYIPWRDK
jgi:hypothetical protein